MSYEAARKESGERYKVPAVEQAMRVLLCLADAASPFVSLMDIATQVGIHRSKAFSILHTLQGFGLIQRNGDRKGYSVGPGLVALSRKVLDAFNVPRLAEPILEELAIKTGGTAVLGLIAGESVYAVAKHEAGVNIGVTVRIGHCFPLTLGSHGKAIAAHMKEKDLNRLLAGKALYFHGEPANLDRDRLTAELAQCRLDGFALDLGEVDSPLNTISAPVLGVGETPVGHIILVGLFSVEVARQMGPLVAEAGKALSRQLGAGVDGGGVPPVQRRAGSGGTNPPRQ